LSDPVSPEELHHHDIVHFALDKVAQELADGRESEIYLQLKEHLQKNRLRKTPT